MVIGTSCRMFCGMFCRMFRVDLAHHFRRRHLSRCGCFTLVQSGISIWSTFGKALDTRALTLLAHCESDEFCGIERVIQRQDSGDGSIVLTVVGYRGGDDFGDVGPDGEAFLCQRFKCFDGVRATEIVI